MLVAVRGSDGIDRSERADQGGSCLAGRGLADVQATGPPNCRQRRPRRGPLKPDAAKGVRVGVDLVCLDQPIDTTTPHGKLFFTILAAFAEFERDLIRERTNDGLAATTARGRNGGRKHRLTPGQVQAARDLRAAGRSVKEIGQLLGNGKPVSRQTVYRALGMLAT
jgi:hypothetical protein